MRIPFVLLCLAIISLQGIVNAEWISPSWSDDVVVINTSTEKGLQIRESKVVMKNDRIRFVPNSDYDKATVFLFIRAWGKINGNWHKFFITTNDPKTPVYSEEIKTFNHFGENHSYVEKTYGYYSDISHLGYTFPVYIGIQGNTLSEKFKIKTNFTTPLNLQDTAIEYVLVLNPALVDEAKKIKYVRVWKKDEYDSELGRWNYTTHDYPISQVLDKSGQLSDMVKEIGFVLENGKVISLFNFEDIFLTNNTHWKINQITLPDSSTTWALHLGSKWGGLNSGETLVIDPSWTTPSAVSNYSGQQAAHTAAHTIDNNLATYWRESVGVDSSSYDWYITYDMGSIKAISGTRLYIYPENWHSPCKVGVLKVCDDAACSGESNLLSSSCVITYESGYHWYYCYFTETGGRYVYLEGGIRDQFSSACINKLAGSDMNTFYELDMYIQDLGIFSVSLNSPANNTNTTDVTPDANFNITGNKASYSCTLYMDDTNKGTNSSVLNNTNTIIPSSSLSDGTYSWYVNCTAATITNQSEIRQITVDTTPPTTSASAIEDDGSPYTFNTLTNSSYVNVTLSCSDGSGVGCDVTLYCTDAVNSCTPTTTYASPVQISTEGTSYIRYLSNDTLDNDEIANSQTIKIDTTSPSISYNTNTDTSGNYSRTHIFINITAADTNKDTVRLNWNGSWESFSSNSGDLYWSNKTGLGDGTYTFYGWINDSVEHTNQTATRTVDIDTTPPTVTLNKPTDNGNYTTNTTTLNITATDAGIGVDACWYSLDSWATNTSFNHSQEHTLNLSDGSNTLKVACNDTLNNLNDTTTATIYYYNMTIHAPPNNYTTNLSHVFFNITLNSAADNCTHHDNGTDTIMNRLTSTTYTLNRSVINGTSYWNISCIMTDNGYTLTAPTPNYNYTVNTTVPDTTPCDIYGCTPQSVAFSWSTSYVSLACYSNEPCSLRYDIINRGYDSMLNPFTSTGGTTHTVQVPVEVNREYLWYITGIDNAGNNHSSSEATSSCSIDDRTGSGGGGGGENEVEKKYFTVNPRYVGEGYDKPEPAELTQGESKLYVVKNTGKTTLDITLMVEDENVVLPAGIWMDTGEFIVISTPSFFRLERGEEINLQVTADLPESVDKTKKYYVDIMLITTGHEEKIEVMVQYSRERKDGWLDMPAFYGLVRRDVLGLLISIGLVILLACGISKPTIKSPIKKTPWK